MLDSSPIRAPPRKKLKRSASLASLPSPPPSVQQSRKRPHLLQTDSDIGSASEQEEEDIIVRPRILFPLGTSGDPLIIEKSPNVSDDRLSLEPAISSSDKQSVSPKGKDYGSALKSPRTPPRQKSSMRQLPICDAEENPFLGSTPPRSRRARSPQSTTEKPTITYVFKGIKTIVPDPYFDIPESEGSKLDYSHPDYSPPLFKPRLLFPEAYDEGEDSSHSEPRTPENKPTSRLSKVFVDDQGKPLPDSGPEGVRGGFMDADEVSRMAVGPIRNRR